MRIESCTTRMCGEKVVVKGRSGFTDCGETRVNSQQGDAVCVVGLQGHNSLLPPGRTIDCELYCEQMMRLKQEVERKWPELINKRVWFFIMIMLDLTHL
ncbi:jg18671 [Pararge aegeria aegeria]|uniref:Jg18671 protein n=1 Tax=Pararge aegeria aegeria TaxID=348720 RepID=A0A8S4RZW0_9NEOP|nr:jg18671 [Pararge aegeria aegeria]